MHTLPPEFAPHPPFSTPPQVLQSKPQLAAFAGFHGTTSPLHRASQAGHLSTCIAIVELIKLKIAATEESAGPNKHKSSTVRRWKSLLRTVLDQRTHRGQTPLMLACERGHTEVTAYLLAQGADPLIVDMMHARTPLHFAAIGGHAGCVKVLCADATTVVIDGHPRPLRDVITHDLSVQSAKFIDQRSIGGLTALHFAAVSGDLDTMQALLRAGASIMVKTDSEAFIGQEYLTPGSTPLHISVIVGSLPLAHALLQAHADMMTVAGGGQRDERRRRPWEGHSRSDIRSMRNASRKLPYHLARDRGWTQMMHLVDPRVPADAALDAARDTDHGIGPKNLATICSIVLQQSLLQWLDQRATEIEVEREDEQRREAAEAAADAGVTLTKPPTTTSPPLPPPPSPPSHPMSTTTLSSSSDASAGVVVAQAPTTAMPASPFAAFSSSPPPTTTTTLSSTSQQQQHRGQSLPIPTDRRRLHSCPVTPQETTLLGTSIDTDMDIGGHHQHDDNDADGEQQRRPPKQQQQQEPSSAPPVPSVTLESMGSLHAYLGMLSVRRPPPPAPLPAAHHHHHHHRRGTSTSTSMTGTPATQSPVRYTYDRNSRRSGRGGMPRAASAGMLTSLMSYSGGSGGSGSGSSVGMMMTPNNTAILSTTDATPVAPPGVLTTTAASLPPIAPPTAPAAAAAPMETQTSAMRRVLSTLVDRLKSPTTTTQQEAAAGDDHNDAKHPTTTTVTATATAISDDCKSTVCGSTCSADSHSTGGDDSSSSECGVCLDHAVEVAFSGCEHALCLECARNLTKQEKKPPSCPFCRRMVVGFLRVPTGMSSGNSSRYYAGH